MAECGRRGACGFEQCQLHAGICDVILAAHDMRDAGVYVIDDTGQRVEERSVSADENGVGQRSEIDRLITPDQVIPRDERRLRSKAPALSRVREAKSPVRLLADRYLGR